MHAQKRYNIGLSILRMIMCFMVILTHCWDATNAQGILYLFSWIRSSAVPIFMIMSFIFMQKMLVEHNKQKIIERFERLLIPQIGWAIIYWIVYKLLDIILNLNLGYSIKDLLWQIFTGHSYNATMWYQTDLIILTFLFLVVIFVFKYKFTYILLTFGAGAIFIQYSGLNLYFMNWCSELKYPIGRFSEVLPFAVLGFFISYTNILDKIKKHQYFAIGTCLYTIFFLRKYDVFTSLSGQGYGYQGIKRSVMAFAIVVLFYCIPFDKIPPKIEKILKIITSHTLGIYCMHRLIATLLNIVIQRLEINFAITSFRACILIYIICFICSCIGTLIVGKTMLKSLFD